MKILGVELSRGAPPSDSLEHTLVGLSEAGRVDGVRRVRSLPELASAVAELAAGAPFALGVNTPVLVPPRSARSRPVEGVVRRRLGVKLQPGGRSSLTTEPLGVASEALMAGLAAAGLPCLPYPDRERRRSGLAEAHPELTLKALLWMQSTLAGIDNRDRREELFRGYHAAAYRAVHLPARTGWAERVAALELALRALGHIEGFDLSPTLEAMAGAADAREVEQAATLLDAALIAGTVRRYLVAPEQSLFVGDTEGGYVVMPADEGIRALVLSGQRRPAGTLFPTGSLRERLGDRAKLRTMDLLSVPGRPQRLEATFEEPPCYEFDNLDEMLWWKHCRHVAGPHLPTEGLCELHVTLDAHGKDALRLVRSRHRTLSFRFDPPQVWRSHAPTRDGRTYPFRVLRAVYETLPSQG